MFSFLKKSDKVSKQLVENQGLLPKEAGWQLERTTGYVRKLSSRYPNLWMIAGGAGACCFFLAVRDFYMQGEAEKEIKFRAGQLAQPAHELKGEEAYNFPWNSNNVHDWLYRPVIITGRPRHSQAMLVPRKVDKYDGYDYIVPLITKENDDGTEEYGVLLNKGWIPHEYRHVGTRLRIENADPQKFLAYVSLNSELDYKQKFFKKGNSPKAVRNHWDHVYLPDMADATGFKNADQMKLALLECVDPTQTKIDERDPKHYAKGLSVEEDYPYAKSYSGALQLNRMPWHYKTCAYDYFTLGTASTLIALGLKFL